MISISEMFISNAYADGAAAAPQGGDFMQFLPLVALLAVFYFLILRPQQKRVKEQKAMIEALQKGDEVATVGGVLGKVVKVGEDNVAVEISDNVVVQVQKAAVQNVLPKGTIKSI
ncbi:Sec translocon accessory complex subunit YajC [Sideroxyarcus emersonii]|uniref:Sec translocon accessory complex subunit YajC n=2 Tax=Sideroxyarcus emersonii TaxID=2764705 RepID=A0AAN2BYG8_9PROT|nr:Sec translocon accessory complex subunit YajC [Sideroxyarcus emersonii]